MRLLLIAVTIFLFQFKLQGQSQPFPWITNVEEALEKVKTTGKPLFLYAYLPTCSYCKQLEPYFSDDEVVKAYNDNFIGLKFDLSKQPQYLVKKNIYLPSYPQFLFFDKEANLIHQGVAEPKRESFINMVKVAQDPVLRAESYKKRFEEGERGFNFLVSYAIYSQVIQDREQNIAAGQALFDGYSKEELGSETSWAITKRIVKDNNNGFFKFWIDKQDVANGYEKKSAHGVEASQPLGMILVTSLRSYKPGDLSISELVDLRKDIDKLGEKDAASNLLWEYELSAYQKAGDENSLVQLYEQLSQRFSKNGAMLVYMSGILNGFEDGGASNMQVQKWLAAAKPQLNENNQLAEYFYETARLNKKMGKADLAKSNAFTALGFAKKAGVKLDKFEKL